MTTLLGNVIDDRYELLAQIGSGGMGTVYRAMQHPFEREVALKVLADGLQEPAQDSESLARFEREALAISKLKHKNIVMFYGYGVYRGAPYMVMEYIHGHSLQHALRSNTPLDPHYTIRVIEQIAEALSCAHTNGLVHRDLKPSNVMIVDNTDALTVKIIDFGLALLLPSFGKQLQKLTDAGSAVGSALYMSPEQCTGLPTDARSDIYAVGCIMYHCLTGVPPFNGDHSVVVMQHHVNQPALRMNTLVPDVSITLQAIVDRAMAKDPADRYQTADELLSDVRAFIAGREVAAETKAAVADQVASADHSFDSQQHTSSLDASKSKARKIRNLAVAAAISAVSVTGFFLTEQLGANSSQDITHDYTMWMLSRKAAAAQHDENYAEAAPLYERIVRLNRKHKLLNFDEGDAAVESLVSCDLHLGKYDDARRVIREQFAKSGPRIRKESGGPALAGRYLTAADMIPDREDGVVFLKEIVATMRSKSEPAWQPYANMLIGRLTSMHRNDAAIALADEVLPAFEDDADKVVLLNSKGLALRQAQRLDEANEAFRQAVALAKDKDFTNASVLHSVGTADLFLGRYIEARQTLEEASTDPNLAPSVRPTLANCYASLGNYHAAARALTDSLDDALKQEPLAAAFTRSAVASSCKTILAGISSTAGDDRARFERIQRRAQTETTPIPHPN